ncbi:hypothetical protein TREPR_2593 [Treponema primitia ZAS-2]|uniref:Uncharacterized protein n=1 Tax=Treponema primitia (strain ATCC BAA-887 / DSM 12427 / ZAS-2) TaxID=545694 RepID=F5YGJ1_TREPZ|nr:hypothetical protein [Treponema primitia]AEF86365.1 hypothetical protein TREPR_2593 [Treponema primitia ZAS-2]
MNKKQDDDPFKIIEDELKEQKRISKALFKEIKSLKDDIEKLKEYVYD